MPAQSFHVQLGRSPSRRTLAILAAVNLFLTATTAAFIYLWGRFETLGPMARVLTRHVLVQGHLATENVVAAWYSAMLLFGVALLSMIAFAADGSSRRSRLRGGWLGLAGIFLTLSLDEIGSLHERIGMIAALSPSGRPVGWVYLLALPISAVAAGMAAFAFAHLRHVRVAPILMGAGTLLFVMNPVLEAAEMKLLRADGGTGGWPRRAHDVLLVLEEGGVELFGALCFVAAVAIYLQRSAPDGVTLRTSLVQRVAVVTTLCAGAYLSPRVVDALPAGDSGLPQHWFPAAAWMVVALAAFARHPLLASLATGVSASMGAGLYMYSQTMTSSAAWVVPVAATLLAGLALEVLLWSYRLSLSPRSSIASPTLRRPRPNPS